MTLDTMKVSGKDYAKVPTRLKEFRERNPRASVETEPTITGEMVVFKTTIIADKADKNSATSTGHSYGKLTGDKAFERLETVSVGRALSLLGYLNNGEVASTEEMQEFEEFKATIKQSAIDEAIVKLNAASTIDDLRRVFTSLGTLIAEKQVVNAKDAKKAELEQANASVKV